MKNTILIILLFFVALTLQAQPKENWDQEKLTGQRYAYHEQLRGSPFLFDDWINGTVTLISGEVIEDVPIKYNAYLDELITYNPVYFTIVKLDKYTLHRFEFDLFGEHWLFEKRFFPGFPKGDRFFRILHEGQTDLLCFYKVSLLNTSPYKDENNILKNQEFFSGYRYFLFQPESDFTSVRLRRKSLLRYVGKADMKEARQLIRKGNLELKDVAGFSSAMQFFEENMIGLNF